MIKLRREGLAATRRAAFVRTRFFRRTSDALVAPAFPGAFSHERPVGIAPARRTQRSHRLPTLVGRHVEEKSRGPSANTDDAPRVEDGFVISKQSDRH